jgi:hypothetical protein
VSTLTIINIKGASPAASSARSAIFKGFLASFTSAPAPVRATRHSLCSYLFFYFLFFLGLVFFGGFYCSWVLLGFCCCLGVY